MRSRAALAMIRIRVTCSVKMATFWKIGLLAALYFIQVSSVSNTRPCLHPIAGSRGYPLGFRPRRCQCIFVRTVFPCRPSPSWGCCPCPGLSSYYGLRSWTLTTSPVLASAALGFWLRPAPLVSKRDYNCQLLSLSLAHRLELSSSRLLLQLFSPHWPAWSRATFQRCYAACSA